MTEPRPRPLLQYAIFMTIMLIVCLAGVTCFAWVQSWQ